MTEPSKAAFYAADALAENAPQGNYRQALARLIEEHSDQGALIVSLCDDALELSDANSMRAALVGARRYAQSLILPDEKPDPLEIPREVFKHFFPNDLQIYDRAAYGEGLSTRFQKTLARHGLKIVQADD